jgi:hypothetical protein
VLLLFGAVFNPVAAVPRLAVAALPASRWLLLIVVVVALS